MLSARSASSGPSSSSSPIPTARTGDGGRAVGRRPPDVGGGPVGLSAGGTGGTAAAPEPARGRRPQPPNAGKAWSAQEDAALETAFDAGIPMKQVAQELGRTQFAVEQRLIKIGKVAAPAGGGRFTAAAPAN